MLLYARLFGWELTVLDGRNITIAATQELAFWDTKHLAESKKAKEKMILNKTAGWKRNRNNTLILDFNLYVSESEAITNMDFMGSD